MVWQRQERVAPPSLYKVSGLVPLGPETVEEGGKGLRMGTSESAGGEKAVEGGSSRGCSGVSGGYGGRSVLSVGAVRAPRVEEVGEGEVSEGEEGGPGPPKRLYDYGWSGEQEIACG